MNTATANSYTIPYAKTQGAREVELPRDQRQFSFEMCELLFPIGLSGVVWCWDPKPV